MTMRAQICSVLLLIIYPLFAVALFGVAEPEEILGMQANCDVVNTTVNLDLPRDASAVYYPTCVRLPRCDGCCMGDKLECSPSVERQVVIRVMRVMASIRRRPSESLGSRGRSRRNRRRHQRRSDQPVFLVNQTVHEKCECQCKVQAHHCDQLLQRYDENECACVCNNRAEKADCCRDDSCTNNSRYWDDSTCSCVGNSPEQRILAN